MFSVHSPALSIAVAASATIRAGRLAACALRRVVRRARSSPPCLAHALFFLALRFPHALLIRLEFAVQRRDLPFELAMRLARGCQLRLQLGAHGFEFRQVRCDGSVALSFHTHQLLELSGVRVRVGEPFLERQRFFAGFRETVIELPALASVTVSQVQLTPARFICCSCADCCSCDSC